ncbi:hypothetical protein PLANPX_0031 [Lacipirellula parvula]|uniref:Uncharacterized protein n=1 Tax=Lacipirellula parvula TaxID=2650471 RepID=A0A5K7XB42_9BACT|nr:hypothetical protein PLANPX_0031 [Lacipirellula parvula]
MTNDEIRMTNDELKRRASTPYGLSFVIRHSGFVISFNNRVPLL